jgi:hypothetical protein
MTKSNLSLHLAAVGILIGVHAPTTGVIIYLLGLLVGSARRDPDT